MRYFNVALVQDNNSETHTKSMRNTWMGSSGTPPPDAWMKFNFNVFKRHSARFVSVSYVMGNHHVRSTIAKSKQIRYVGFSRKMFLQYVKQL